jgi:glycosyltransferase involved in cell wall biosynthesis
MDHIVANSENVRNRLNHYLGLDAEVIHPPCDVSGYQWQGQEDFYLSTARLEPYKQVDRIIEAFRDMPDKKLVVASGGSDESRLKRLAQDADNIYFTGWISEEELKRLVGTAIVTIYVAKDEDFEMSPVESMAAGKPVIGNAEGGLLETVVHEETGILLPAYPEPSDIAEAVRNLTPKRAQDMRHACQERASQFSRERFLDNMTRAIERITR